jgi:hypothetical protein
MRRFSILLLFTSVVTAFAVSGDAIEVAFYPDDPMSVFPEPADASGVRPRTASQGFDFIENSFFRPGDRTDRRAMNVNTIDEVPDSSWFTNRMGHRRLSADELRRGPDTSDGPIPGKWKVVVGDAGGVTPGLRIQDASGQMYFLKVDQPKNPELGTGAELVSTKIVHALGYNVPENYLAWMTRDMLDISEAEITSDGRSRQMTTADLDDLLDKAARGPDGRFRVIASKAISGRIIGPFRYYGTVPDDPNDIVPHEHRRELRAMRVFAAWLNHMDSRGINSLDTLVEVDGRMRVRHYLLDFGSTLGSAAITVKSRRSGYAYLWDVGESLRTLATFGVYIPHWALIPYPMQLPSVGRFEGDRFDPVAWVPHYPTPAFDNARDDDTFWAARRVAAFTDADIRTVVEAGHYSDPRAADYIAQVLMKRRDKIARAWLTPVNPLVEFELEASGRLRFVNAAVAAGVAAPPREYRIRWARFDNASATSTPVTSEQAFTGTTTSAPPELLTEAAPEYIRAEIVTVHDQYPAWQQPVRVTFRRERDNWTTVGLER